MKRTVGFAAVAGMALALLAAVVLLPAAGRVRSVKAERELLCARVEAFDALIDHKHRLADSIETDPMQTQRLLIAQQNCRRPDEMRLDIAEAPVDVPLTEQIAAQTALATVEPTTLDRISRRIQRPAARRGLLVVAGLLMICAMTMFHPRTKTQ